MSALCPCCQHPGTPGQCPRSHVLHWLLTKGSSPFQLGETVALPALLCFQLGASLLPAAAASWSPRLGQIFSPLCLGCSSLLQLGWLRVDAVGSPWL